MGGCHALAGGATRWVVWSPAPAGALVGCASFQRAGVRRGVAASARGSVGVWCGWACRRWRVVSRSRAGVRVRVGGCGSGRGASGVPVSQNARGGGWRVVSCSHGRGYRRRGFVTSGGGRSCGWCRAVAGGRAARRWVASVGAVRSWVRAGVSAVGGGGVSSGGCASRRWRVGGVVRRGGCVVITKGACGLVACRAVLSRAGLHAARSCHQRRRRRVVGVGGCGAARRGCGRGGLVGASVRRGGWCRVGGGGWRRAVGKIAAP